MKEEPFVFGLLSRKPGHVVMGISIAVWMGVQPGCYVTQEPKTNKTE
jgi:hypothetical protein